MPPVHAGDGTFWNGDEVERLAVLENEDGYLNHCRYDKRPYTRSKGQQRDGDGGREVVG